MLDLPLHSPRLTLRRLSSADPPDFQAHRRNAEMGRVDAGVLGTWFQRGIAARDGDRLIGDIGLCRASLCHRRLCRSVRAIAGLNSRHGR